MADDTTLERVGDTGALIFSLWSTQQTEILYVARTLWVERDQMVLPEVSDGPFNGQLGCNGCDDVLFQPGIPPIDTLQTLLEKTLVSAIELPAAHDRKDGVVFEHNSPLDGAPHPNSEAVRDVKSEKHFWTVQNVGAYEYVDLRDLDNDFDSNGNPIFDVGYSYVEQSDSANLVFFETIRDFYATFNSSGNNPGWILEHNFVSRVSAHEALHRFFGSHTRGPWANFGIMEDAITLVTMSTPSLTVGQYRVIQNTEYPH